MAATCNHTGTTEPAQPSQMHDDISVDARSESGPGEATHNPQAPAMANAEWCLIVAPDGDYPKLELFHDLAGLKARLRELDEQGGMVNAFPFYGVPMAFTGGKSRFLYLPDGQIEPLCDFRPYGRFIPNPGAQPPIDRRFYIGPPELDEGVPDAIVDHRRPADIPGDTRKQQHERQEVPADPSASSEEVEAAPLEPCMSAMASE